ncbi:Serpin A3-7 [Thelohanellus kitauei]|uniref:Serpin A3-7 n=1 Tax=Thelohanellus kitauei TaxID=669202 RepID=A0A0C2JCT6_THEKT|nr:Serpin A3-7 [Thelohanellus kitauei]
MADRANDLTLKLAKFLMEADGYPITFSISGFIAYVTLSIITKGLRSPAKDRFLDLLNCSYSHLEESHERSFLEFKCLNSNEMIDFEKAGRVKSAIFHTKTPYETFKQMAFEHAGIEFQIVHDTNYALQYHLINEWGKTLEDVPFTNIFIESMDEELSLLIFNEYFVRFQWKSPFNPKTTKDQYFKNIYDQDVRVDMMRRIMYSRYYDDQELMATIVFIPLEQDDMYAAVVLPHSTNNIMDLLRNMNVSLTLDLGPKSEIMVS